MEKISHILYRRNEIYTTIFLQNLQRAASTLTTLREVILQFAVIPITKHLASAANPCSHPADEQGRVAQ